MNLRTLLVLLAIQSTLIGQASASVLISNFGTDDSISGATFENSWVGALSENTTFSTIGSPATDFGLFTLVQSLDLTGTTSFSISARLDSGNTAPGFTVIAYNSLTDFVSADFSAASFTSGGFSTATGTFTTTGTFNPSSVTSWGISGGSPSSTTAFRVSFDNLTAVPEPQAWVMIIGALMLMTIFRKRSKALA